MYFEQLSSEEKVSYLIKPIIKVLQAAGGQLERSVIRDRIAELDEHIAEFEQQIYTSNKTGRKYKPFDFSFNFAIKELAYVDLISYERYKPKITLTKAGSAVNLDTFDVELEVRDKAQSYWRENSSNERAEKEGELEADEANKVIAVESPLDELNVKLESAISNMNNFLDPY